MNNRGFTLIELIAVLGILSALMHMAILSFTDSRSRANDASAITDARHLVTVATETFVIGEKPDFSHTPGMGQKVGLKSDGSYAYTLSQNVEAFIVSNPAGARQGYIEAIIYNAAGSSDPTAMIGGRRNFYCVVDEANNITIAPSF